MTDFSLFPGELSPVNKMSADWAAEAQLLAIQTLDAHAANVVRVKWSRRFVETSDLNSRSGQARVAPSSTTGLYLASADVGGHIFIWDVSQSRVVMALGGPLELGGRSLGAVTDLCWHPTQSNLLLSLHSPSSLLVLWDLSRQDAIWFYTFPELVTSFQFNPFDESHIAAATSSGFIYFVRDVRPNLAPQHVDLKYRISGANHDNPVTHSAPTGKSDLQGSRDGEKEPTSGQSSEERDFVQMLFSSHSRNIMYFLLKRRVLVFDLAIHQAIGSLALDRNRSSFASLIHCRNHPHILFMLHEDGLLSSWSRKHLNQPSYTFELRSTMELVNVGLSTKKNDQSILSIVNGPLRTNELDIVAIRSDGTIWLVEYRGSTDAISNLEEEDPELLKKKRVALRARTGVQRIDLTHSGAVQEQNQVYIPSGRFILKGQLSALASDIASLCPAPFEGVEHLVVVGTQSGFLQLIDTRPHSLGVMREFKAAKNLPVRGLRWLDPSRVIFFVIDGSSSDKGRYKNDVCVFDLENGKVTYVRQKTEAEATFIRGIRPSPLRNYVVILLKAQPFQIFDLKTGGLMKSINVPMQITAFAWADPSSPPLPYPHPGKEDFVFTTPDGGIHHYAIENSLITPLPLSLPVGFGALSVVSSLAWQGNWLVGGDTGGALVAWNFERGQLQTIQTERGHIRRVQFEPPSISAKAAVNILVHFNDGSCGVWDLEKSARISSSTYLTQRGLSTSVVDWASPGKPLTITSDGALRILDIQSLTISSSPLNNSQLFESSPLLPSLLPVQDARTLKSIMFHFGPGAGFLLDPLSFGGLVEKIDSQVIQGIVGAPNAMLRGQKVSEFFGDAREIDLWTVANDSVSRARKTRGVASLIDAAVGAEADPFEEDAAETVLPQYFDLLLDTARLREIQDERALLHLNKRSTSSSAYHLTKKVADFQLLLGHKDKAIELLLESQHDPKHFFTDALKACVIAASVGDISQNVSFQNTVKLVATTLIAQDQIAAGTQLLTIIGKGADACRYLQSYDKWTDAAWLAKVSLPFEDANSIMRRWAQHMADETGELTKAIQVVLSTGDFVDALHLLERDPEPSLAAIFARGLSEEGLVEPTMKPAIVFKNARPTSEVLISIYTRYSQHLARLGIKAAADFYSDLASKTATQSQSIQSPRAASVSRNSSTSSLI